MDEIRIPPLCRPLLLLALVLSQGCFLPGRSQIDYDLRDLHAEANATTRARTVDAVTTAIAESRLTLTKEPLPAATRQAAYQPGGAGTPKLKIPERLKPPSDLPGADYPRLEFTPKMTREQREKAVAAFYPPTPPLPPEKPLAPGPEGHPMTLADLQRLAETYSPAIKNAQAAVDAARGAARQAGMYPNPTFSFENDTLATGPAGYPGFSIEQLIKTGGKLKLAQAAALMDVLNAKVALRRAQTDLSYAVRTAYFGVLVARENVRINEALFRFTENIYRYHVEMLRRGGLPVAAYEPGQLRALVLGARLAAIQGRNQFHASWRQLAANLGLPDMPPSELAGKVDMPVPVFDQDQVRALVFKNHTDVIIAQNNIRKAKYSLELAKLVPLPDVDTRLLVQKDYTAPPNQIASSVQFSVPVPIWDQNKGGIRQAEAQLAQALVGPDQARISLANTLADAFNRYETGKMSVEVAAQQIRDQLRAYVGVSLRREQQPAESGGVIAFADLVTAQQTLAGFIAGYITALGAQWQAVVDVANVMQTDDLFAAAPCHDQLRVPDLSDLDPDGKHHKLGGWEKEGSGPKPGETAEITATWTDANPKPGTIPGAPALPAGAPIADPPK